jgi:predicted small secreted protein
MGIETYILGSIVVVGAILFVMYYIIKKAIIDAKKELNEKETT